MATKIDFNRWRRTGNPWQFSPKQLALMFWWRLPAMQHANGIIADGSIRSGKTVGQSMGFMLWAMERFHDQQFGCCGKTIQSFKRNVLVPLLKAMPALGLKCVEHRSENYIQVFRAADGRTNRFYIFGGADESSKDLVQGVTLAGVYFDEVALMPRSFVDQAMARCSVPGSKFWFNCNPAGPSHWFKLRFIDNCSDLGLIYMHFTMTDNASLDPEIVRRYERMFTGVFYRRFIKGEWCLAEGLVYGMFDPATMVVKPQSSCTSEDADYSTWVISMDYGIVNPTAMLLIGWSLSRQRFEVVQEFYYDGHDRSQLTDPEIFEHLKNLAGNRNIKAVIVDPSAASIIRMIQQSKRFKVWSATNTVLPGIRMTQTVLLQGKIVIHEGCSNIIREFGAYSWEQDKGDGVDKVAKEFDHAMDALRYFVFTFIRTNANKYGVKWFKKDREDAA